MNSDVFLSGLRIQFEELDGNKLKMDSKFKDLDTWDSLTRFSIIAFVEDDYKITLKNDELNNLETPLALFEYISIKTNKKL